MSILTPNILNYLNLNKEQYSSNKHIAPKQTKQKGNNAIIGQDRSCHVTIVTAP